MEIAFGMLATGGFFALMALLMVVVFRNEQEKRERRQELERMGHEERLALIERGLHPGAAFRVASPEPADAPLLPEGKPMPLPSPSSSEHERKQIYQALGGAVTVPSVFAFLSHGSVAAWTAVGVIGAAAVAAMVIIFLYGHGRSSHSASTVTELRRAPAE